MSLGTNQVCGIVKGAAKCWCVGNSCANHTPIKIAGKTESKRALKSTITVAYADTTPVTKISVGENHTCFIQGGGAFCYGQNDNGQLGDGTTNDADVTSPVAVLGLSSNVTDIAATTNALHACAVMSGGLYCWGNNYHGVLGIGAPSNHVYTPTPVPAPFDTGVLGVAVGLDFTCAIKSDGTVWCWVAMAMLNLA